MGIYSLKSLSIPKIKQLYFTDKQIVIRLIQKFLTLGLDLFFFFSNLRAFGRITLFCLFCGPSFASRGNPCKCTSQFTKWKLFNFNFLLSCQTKRQFTPRASLFRVYIKVCDLIGSKRNCRTAQTRVPFSAPFVVQFVFFQITTCVFTAQSQILHQEPRVLSALQARLPDKHRKERGCNPNPRERKRPLPDNTQMFHLNILKHPSVYGLSPRVLSEMTVQICYEQFSPLTIVLNGSLKAHSQPRDQRKLNPANWANPEDFVL